MTCCGKLLDGMGLAWRTPLLWIALLGAACTESSPDRNVPADAGAPQDAAEPDASLTCETVLSESFDDGLGQLVASTRQGFVDVDNGSLRASLEPDAEPGAYAHVDAEFDGRLRDVRMVRLTYTMRLSSWERGYELTGGCRIGFPENAPRYEVRLNARSDLPEGMEPSFVADSLHEDVVMYVGAPILPDEPRVLGLEARSDDGIRFSASVLEGDIVQGDPVGFHYSGGQANPEIRLRCGIVWLTTNPGGSVQPDGGVDGGVEDGGSEPPAQAVWIEDVQLEICR